MTNKVSLSPSDARRCSTTTDAPPLTIQFGLRDEDDEDDLEYNKGHNNSIFTLKAFRRNSNGGGGRRHSNESGRERLRSLTGGLTGSFTGGSNHGRGGGSNNGRGSSHHSNNPLYSCTDDDSSLDVSEDDDSDNDLDQSVSSMASRASQKIRKLSTKLFKAKKNRHDDSDDDDDDEFAYDDSDDEGSVCSRASVVSRASQVFHKVGKNVKKNLLGSKTGL